ncbi:MAG: P-loop NTPase [Oligoflexia bacterium]|nr:P-loop NTPase [Oligoflexia bacterium]
MGKTIVTVNLALALTETEKRVVILDADFGNANAHTLLGITEVKQSIEDFFVRDANLNDLILKTNFKNLYLICGGMNKIDYALYKTNGLKKQIREILADFILLDLGAGISNEHCELYNLADEKIMVVTPQLTSLQNAYSFAKSTFMEDLRSVREMSICLQHIDNDLFRLVQAIKKLPSEHFLHNKFAQVLKKQKMWILANMTHGEKELHTVYELKNLVKEYLEIEATILGELGDSRDVQNSINEMIPFIMTNPQSENAKRLRKIALNLSEY